MKNTKPVEEKKAKRCYLCQCTSCGSTQQYYFFVDDIPSPDQFFSLFCHSCKAETPHRLVLTKKLRAEQHRIKAEAALREEIESMCKENGFSCRFLYQSVIITTPIADWAFDYHLPAKTLYHESTMKINFKTGAYAKSHVQFRDKKMKNADVIRYIQKHDAAKHNP